MVGSLAKVVELPKLISSNHMSIIKYLARKVDNFHCVSVLFQTFPFPYIYPEFRHEVECCNFFNSAFSRLQLYKIHILQ